MAHGNSHSSAHHITPFKTYVVVYVTLLILTFITVGVSRIDLGALNMFVAMFVASVKAAIVALWFMHLKYENKLNRVVFASGFFFLLVMFAFTALDIFSRGNFLNIYGK